VTSLSKSTQCSKFRTVYRDWICFNKNLILAGICSLFIAAVVTQYYDDVYNKSNSGGGNIHLVTFVSLLTECVVETPIFILLYYYDNKNRFVDPLGGKVDFDMIKFEIKKLLMAFSISDVIYAIVQILLLFYFLNTFELEAYQSVIYSSIVSWSIFVVALNVSTKSLGFFEKGNKKMPVIK
jgi:hypothetical protein